MWRHSTLIITSLIALRQSIAASIQRLPDSVVQSAQLAIDKSRCVKWNVQVIGQFEVRVDFIHLMYIKYKHMLVFNLIFHYCGQVGVPQYVL